MYFSIENVASIYNFSTTSKNNDTWLSFQQTHKKDIPFLIQPWLSETGSITKKLQLLGKLTIDILFDKWGKPTISEQKKLGLQPRSVVREREIVLKVDGIPVVYARVIIPNNALKGNWRYLAKLGKKPLGNFIFKRNKASRGTIDIAQLTLPPHTILSEAVWARRSIFYQYGQGILVSEAFLPTITRF